jgi:hypothetical protein
MGGSGWSRIVLSREVVRQRFSRDGVLISSGASVSVSPVAGAAHQH